MYIGLVTGNQQKLIQQNFYISTPSVIWEDDYCNIHTHDKQQMSSKIPGAHYL